MIEFLYITADKIGAPTGGGKVTGEEFRALQDMGPTTPIEVSQTHDPFLQDAMALDRVQGLPKPPRLAHCYSGCLTRTVEYLRSVGCKVAYTCCAHSVEVSRREHEQLNIPYSYPHLTDPVLWKRYSRGYWTADILVAPSPYSRDVLISQGAAPDKVRVISHGVDLPANPYKAPPDDFRVGYLGAVGPDKGLRYLLSAWKQLNYPDATLVLGGRDSTSSFMQHLIRQFGGGNIRCLGWVEDIAEFYNQITVYCQPSASEAFGLEVLEAMAYGRAITCSDGAGASFLLKDEDGEEDLGHAEVVAACDISDLAESLAWHKKRRVSERHVRALEYRAAYLAWDKIREQYKNLWKEML